MTGPTWRCSDCDTYNDAAVRVCDLCETPRREATAPRAASGAASGPKSGEPRKPPVKKPPVKKPPVKKPPARTGTGATGSRSVLSELDWVCAACGHRVAGRINCDACGTLWTPEVTTIVHGDPLYGSFRLPSSPPDDLVDSLLPKPTPREPTRGEVAAGCGCLLFLASVVVTLIVLLILNWSTVTSFLTGSDSSEGSAKPSPTVSASGPCPKELAAMLPKGSASGARLVAAYSRDNVKDRYAFCRTEAGKVYYFFAKRAGERYGRPTAAEKSGTGYLVRFSNSSFRFRDLEVTAYDKGGKELWKEELTPEASAD
ncbi:hypothetical protein IM697_04615 [Streptomyces ferrugineus]|uniref:RanBP2-type domain-containing protein n=1 Tax=Streptomyces ferrugineus TaxID=1413221 RepID=A0A7M2SR32_9ACTN|nr:hypothetical protein [Streptomyces ferrugineus]QOV37711.1 hypothetical protein IM697_04615 [Streptomyces ferrugineus]